MTTPHGTPTHIVVARVRATATRTPASAHPPAISAAPERGVDVHTSAGSVSTGPYRCAVRCTGCGSTFVIGPNLVCRAGPATVGAQRATTVFVSSDAT